LDLVDTAVIEAARISRVPHTKHMKTKNYAVHTGSASIDRILEASCKNDIIVNVVDSLVKTNILDYLDFSIKPCATSTNMPYDQKYTSWYPECLIRIIEKIMTNQHATHDERKHLAGYLYRFKLDEHEILEYFKSTSDFLHDKALDQIRSLKGHTGYSCRNIRLIMKDLCPGVCEYIRQVARRRNP